MKDHHILYKGNFYLLLYSVFIATTMAFALHKNMGKYDVEPNALYLDLTVVG